ncbi:nuclear transport factor 2 family protein [Umezawaea endophytica]|uniref:Nuclear transport factor 2 family protein n=1 Tax=Umezawaea endophytica TaxID=1654476 RepID=A0A9X2VJP7_9PSEU|nr:nuclear transport factor 2 family protein [Umezawaea endophytica]MCS7477895.1 nuclear transport factor 2 family protein [Umezawaea endophytica]
MSAVEDRLAVMDVVARLAHAQDDRDWDALRELFADEVRLDLSGQSGAAPVDLTADGLVDKARSVLEGFDALHHAASLPLVEVDGDRATCRVHVVAYHHVPTDGVDFCTMRGRWELGLTRGSGRWLVHRWAVVRTAPWEGSPDVYRIAADRRTT